jgi:hypothetical protein
VAELKTRPTRASVAAFIAGLPDAQVRRDCRTLSKLMKTASRKPPKMWGSAIVGFGDVHYVYASGREGDWFQIGFSPRKGALALYLMTGLGPMKDLLRSLGKHKTGKGCLYVKSLADIDQSVLIMMLDRACTKLAER